MLALSTAKTHTAPSNTAQCNTTNSMRWNGTRARALHRPGPPRPRQNLARTPHPPPFPLRRALLFHSRRRAIDARRGGGRFTDRAGASRGPDRAIVMLSGKARRELERARERAGASERGVRRRPSPARRAERSGVRTWIFGCCTLDPWNAGLGPRALDFLEHLGTRRGSQLPGTAADASRGPPTHARAVVPSFQLIVVVAAPSSRLYNGAARWPACGGVHAHREPSGARARPALPPPVYYIKHARAVGGRRPRWVGGGASGAPPAWRARDDPSSPRAANNQHPHHHNYRHQQY